MMIHCERCDRAVEASIIKRAEEFEVRGDRITIEAEVAICPHCGDRLVTLSMEDANLHRAYAVYRQARGLMEPGEIRMIREGYGLTQREMGRLLGWSPATLSRYERIGCMSPAHNQVLWSIKDRSGGRRLVDARVRTLTTEEANRFYAIFSDDAATAPRVKAVSDAVEDLSRVDLNRVAAMIALLVGVNGAYKIKLMKLMFYSDFVHFRRYGRSISGLSYVHMTHGPAVDNYDLILAVMGIQGLIWVQPVEGKYAGDIIRPLHPVSHGLLDAGELAVMASVVEKLGPLSGSELSRLSHKEDAWKDTVNGQKIPYSYAATLKAFDD